jgi:hypothetical protein
MSTKPDDLEAVRIIVHTLSVFDATEQERILRWSREKLGLPTAARGSAALNTLTPIDSPAPPYGAFASRSHDTATDIKSFIAEKIPSSDNSSLRPLRTTIDSRHRKRRGRKRLLPMICKRLVVLLVVHEYKNLLRLS